MIYAFQPDNSEKTFFVVNQRVDDHDGKLIGISVAAIDITAYKNVERILLQTEGLARRTANLSPNISWSSYAEGTIDFIGSTPDASKLH